VCLLLASPCVSHLHSLVPAPSLAGEFLKSTRPTAVNLEYAVTRQLAAMSSRATGSHHHQKTNPQTPKTNPTDTQPSLKTDTQPSVFKTLSLQNPQSSKMLELLEISDCVSGWRERGREERGSERREAVEGQRRGSEEAARGERQRRHVVAAGPGPARI
jgi:hypothetical protein